MNPFINGKILRHFPTFSVMHIFKLKFAYGCDIEFDGQHYSHIFLQNVFHAVGLDIEWIEYIFEIMWSPTLSR